MVSGCVPYGVFRLIRLRSCRKTRGPRILLFRGRAYAGRMRGVSAPGGRVCGSPLGWQRRPPKNSTRSRTRPDLRHPAPMVEGDKRGSREALFRQPCLREPVRDAAQIHISPPTSRHHVGSDFFVERVYTQEICAKKSAGTEVCASGDQLAAILGGTSAGAPGLVSNTGASDGLSAPGEADVDMTSMSRSTDSSTSTISAANDNPPPSEELPAPLPCDRAGSSCNRAAQQVRSFQYP
jgi:hypothetical protein